MSAPPNEVGFCSVQMQPVALLDVDHTLLLHDNKLNVPLLQSLMNCGITHAYLFTDMTFSCDAIEDRNQLVKALEEYGMAIHGVISPNDLTWAEMDNGECMKLYSMCFHKAAYKGKLHGLQFEDFVLSCAAELPNLSRAVCTYLPGSPPDTLGAVDPLGAAYEEASMEHHRTGALSDELIVKSRLAKAFADHLGERLGYAHNKVSGHHATPTCMYE